MMLLLELPEEIRTLIYRQLFSGSSLTVTANMQFDWPKTTARQNLCLVADHRNASTSILLTCRTIYHEARGVLYQCVDYICIERIGAPTQAFNRFGYEYFDFARTRVRKLWGFPMDCVHGTWEELLFSRFPQLEVVGLEFDTVVPVVEIRQPGAPFPVMTDERLLRAITVLRKTRSLDRTLERLRSQRPNLQVYATFNFIIGHVDEDRQLHIMTLVELIDRKIVKTIYRHEDCALKFDGKKGACYLRFGWPQVLDCLDGKQVDVTSGLSPPPASSSDESMSDGSV